MLQKSNIGKSERRRGLERLAGLTAVWAYCRIVNSDVIVEFQPSPFFAEQLTAFELWLQHGSKDKKPPEQLPIVLQVFPLSSQSQSLQIQDSTLTCCETNTLTTALTPPNHRLALASHRH